MLILRTFLIAVGTLLGGFGLHVAVCRVLGIVGKEPWMSISFISSIAAAGIASVRLTRRWAPREQPVPSLAELERLGRVERESYRARRAFKVEEFEDEGPHYFVELEDGRVLHLSGQYFYDLDNFPCGQFQILRDKEHGWVTALEPQSPGIPLDATLPSFRPDDFEEERVPSDGDFLPEKYDEVLQDLAKRRAG